ncbi:MAG: ElyC/SanA/YdcF family protein [Bacillota bacterium]|nr:ElyC/SanA/YdcF family protein [Bacillota bacterium]
MRQFFLALGVLALIYFALVALSIGLAPGFLYFWLILALSCFAASLLLRWLRRHQRRLPYWLRASIITVTIAMLGLFGWVQYRIISQFTAEVPQDLPAILVLGAQVYQDRTPSPILADRLERARVYLEEVPTAVAVTSGGRGPDEPCPEGEAMADWLESRGVSASRLSTETASHNTAENIRFSEPLLRAASGSESFRCGIVTSNYHGLRALALAMAAGWDETYLIPAPSDPLLLPHNLVREAFALLKDLVVGNLTSLPS